MMVPQRFRVKDGNAAIPGLLKEIEKILIAMVYNRLFDDTGLAEAEADLKETNNWYWSICFSHSGFATW